MMCCGSSVFIYLLASAMTRPTPLLRSTVRKVANFTQQVMYANRSNFASKRKEKVGWEEKK